MKTQTMEEKDMEIAFLKKVIISKNFKIEELRNDVFYLENVIGELEMVSLNQQAEINCLEDKIALLQ